MDSRRESISRIMIKEVIRCGKTAKKMEPAQEEWEKLGFIFEDTGDPYLYKTTLPEGWCMRSTEDYDVRAEMSLCTRYHLKEEDIDEDTTIVYFGNEKEKLFIAGEIKKSADAIECANKRYELYVKAENYGFENYPEWRNPLAYWDEEGIQRGRQ